MTESKPQVLAEVAYDPNSLTASAKKYSQLPPGASGDMVRVGLYDPRTTDWTGIVTSGSHFDDGKAKTLVLHLDHEGHPFHVGFGASTLSREKQGERKKSGASEGLEVVVKAPAQGPQPHLNKPVVLSADGKADEKEPEKTLIQKCVLSRSFVHFFSFFFF